MKKKKNNFKITLKDFIVPTVLPNYSPNFQSYGEKEFNTTDKIYLFSSEEIQHFTNSQRKVLPTDYVIISGISCGPKYSTQRQSCYIHTRSSKTIVSKTGTIENNSVAPIFIKYGIAPCLHLDCEKVIKAKKELGLFEINTKIFRDKSQNHFLEFGYFPQTYVGDEFNKKLSTLKKFHMLKMTGKKYLCSCIMHQLNFREEYIYKGKKYVYTSISNDAINNILKNGQEVLHNSNNEMWFCVEPIKWKILNWNDLPKELNSSGTGKADYIELASTEALLTNIPFNYYDVENGSMWQNSIIRQVLNGYDIRQEMANKNGNPNFQAKQNIPCVGNGFIDQAFGEELLNMYLANTEKVVKKNKYLNNNKNLSPAELARNELIKKALEKKQKEKTDIKEDQNENVL